jgi:hypothetical protein
MFVNNCVYKGRVQYVQRALDIADKVKYLEAIVKFFDHHSRHVNEEVFFTRRPPVCSVEKDS